MNCFSKGTGGVQVSACNEFWCDNPTQNLKDPNKEGSKTDGKLRVTRGQAHLELEDKNMILKHESIMPYTKYTWFTARDEGEEICLKNYKGPSSISNSLQHQLLLWAWRGIIPFNTNARFIHGCVGFSSENSRSTSSQCMLLACRSAIFSAHHQCTTKYKSPLRNWKIHRWLTFFSRQKTILWSDRGTRHR